jgi:hypothetical protein
LVGITTYAGIERVLAAHASACAWLPELWVTTPRPAIEGSSARTAESAPRALKEPVFWKLSHL